MAYLMVYGTGYDDRLAVYRFPTTEEARRGTKGLVPGVPPGYHSGGSYAVIPNQIDTESFKEFTTTDLIALYNALRGSSVKKFESREIGIKRIITALEAAAVNPPTSQGATATPPSEGEGNMEPNTAVQAAAPQRREPGTKPPKYDKERRIRIIAANPGREGTRQHRAWETMHTGMTLKDWGDLTAGDKELGWLSDIHRGVERGYLVIE